MTPEEFKVLTQEYLDKAESFVKVNDEKRALILAYRHESVSPKGDVGLICSFNGNLYTLSSLLYFTLKQEEIKEITRYVYAALSDVIKDWDKDLKGDFEDVE